MKLFRLESSKHSITITSTFPLCILWSHTPLFVPGHCEHHFFTFFFLRRKIFAYIVASLLNVYQWRPTLVALWTKLYHWQIMPNTWMRSKEEMWEFVILLPVLSRDWISASLLFLNNFPFCVRPEEDNKMWGGNPPRFFCLYHPW